MADIFADIVIEQRPVFAEIIIGGQGGDGGGGVTLTAGDGVRIVGDVISADKVSAIETVTTSGTVVINSVTCNVLTLDMASVTGKIFLLISDQSNIAITLINRVDYADCILHIRRSTASTMNVYFQQSTILYDTDQSISATQPLFVAGRTGGTTQQILFDIINDGVQKNTVRLSQERARNH